MTFCLGLISHQGLLAIADTRITSGTEVSRAPKISVHEINGAPLFILTSGLRSVRDKTVTYFGERLSSGSVQLNHAYEATNQFAEEVRRVHAEDNEWLTASGMSFDLHCIVGGKLAGDELPQMFLVYPEGNWVEVSRSTPYTIIGESRYGKPVLDRLWRYESSLADGFRVGLLAFTETKASASNVDYPLDVVLYQNEGGPVDELHITQQDGARLEEEWHRALTVAANAVAPVSDELFAHLREAPQEPIPLIDPQAQSAS